MQGTGQVIQRRRFATTLQAQGDSNAHIGVVIAVAQVRGVVGVRAARPPLRLAARRPAPIAGAQLRRLKVGHPHAGGRFPVNAGGEHQPVLQPLVPFPFRAPPAQGIGEQAGQH